MTTTIDRDKALEMIEAAIAERGEMYVYTPPTEDCVYGTDSAPSCIVGVAFALAGYKIPTNADALEQGIYVGTRVAVSQAEAMHEKKEVGIMGAFTLEPGDDFVVRAFEKLNDLKLTPGAARVLQTAQNKQDYGYTWGVSLAAAKEAE